MTVELIFTNARIVTRDSVFAGTVQVEQDRIAGIDDGRSALAAAIDLQGDYLLPGLIELHTDNLEKHVSPRPGVWWPGLPAMVAHDAQLATAGITTVFDALTLGDRYRTDNHAAVLVELVAAVKEGSDRDVLRAEHRLHLRCEITYGGLIELFEPLVGDPAVGLISLMDHTPGDRQFADIEIYKQLFQLSHQLGEDGVRAHVAALKADQERYSDRHRAAIVAAAHRHGKVLASHDDSCRAHVEQAHRAAVAIAEFPTTLEAAAAARELGLRILMGAPNLVRGGSHSGNIAAAALAQAGLLDILSSDYYPASLLHGAFLLAGADFEIPLPQAIAMVTAIPAAATGLDDRGEIACGKRADLIHVRAIDAMPIVRGVWRQGRRVA